MTQRTTSDHGATRRWAAIAVAAAAVAGLLVTAWQVSPRLPARADCACSSDETLRREVAELRGQVDQLRFAVQIAATTGFVAPAAQVTPPAPTPVAPAAPRLANEAPGPAGPAAGATEYHVDVAAPGGRIGAYEHFDIPTSAVTIQQSSAGDLVVRNTDPALAGQTIVVRAYTADPAPQLLRIVVPPATGP
jgi:outer membrane murein-binding lipoprotein Lpp